MGLQREFRLVEQVLQRAPAIDLSRIVSTEDQRYRFDFVVVEDTVGTFGRRVAVFNQLPPGVGHLVGNAGAYERE